MLNVKPFREFWKMTQKGRAERGDGAARNKPGGPVARAGSGLAGLVEVLNLPGDGHPWARLQGLQHSGLSKTHSQRGLGA